MEAHHVAKWVKLLPTLVGAAGILLAYILYMQATNLPGKIVQAFKVVHSFLYHKWYFDELYHIIGVVPAFFIGDKLWKIGDGKIIDGMGPDAIAAGIASSSRGTGKIQTGYVFHYAFAMLIGVVCFITAYLFIAYR